MNANTEGSLNRLPSYWVWAWGKKEALHFLIQDRLAAGNARGSGNRARRRKEAILLAEVYQDIPLGFSRSLTAQDLDRMAYADELRTEGRTFNHRRSFPANLHE